MTSQCGPRRPNLNETKMRRRYDVACRVGGYLFERLKDTIGYSLKKHEAVFLKRQNSIFSIAARSMSFGFCFRLNIFTSKI